jgi:CDP-glycerol glycerophosphotransferase (TagB/SpsB family)
LNLLFFITKPYSVSILEPIVKYCESRSDLETAWFKIGSASQIHLKGKTLNSSNEVHNYNPDAVIVPGNVVPDFWPGLKVQIFHGLGEEKKGHYDITEFFDLYCTPGSVMTSNFMDLQKKHQSFLVKETGWPKLDAIELESSIENSKSKLGLDPSRTTILYAPTFSPKYTSAHDLFSTINLLQTNNWQWIVKFHDLEKNETLQKYGSITSDNFRVIKDNNILPWLATSDILLGDTSSVMYEFLSFDRPMITYNAITRLDKGINIHSPEELLGAITRCMLDPEEFSPNRMEYLDDIHPYQDGNSSERVLNAIQEVIDQNKLENLKVKKPNWIRKRQIRKMVKE